MSLKGLISKYQFFVASETPLVERIRSGILAFDIVTGGGIPKGKFTIFHGDKSTGKSTTALKIINNFLLSDKRNVLFIDFENSFDGMWAKHFISDLNRVFVFRPDYGEQGIEVTVKASESSPDEIGLIVIDSLATIVPTKEADSDIYSQHIGIQARLINTMFRRLLPRVSINNKNKTEITYLLINQVRMKIDGYGNPNIFIKPGGKMQDATASLDIRFYVKEYLKHKDIPYAIVYQINVEKNKVGGIPKRTAQYIMYIADYDGYKIGETRDEQLMVSLLRKNGTLIREGNKWLMSGHEFRNLNEVFNMLRGDKTKREKIYDFLVETFCSNVLSYVEGEDNDS